MTDSPKDLTESVFAPGKTVEGTGQTWEQQKARYDADPVGYQDSLWNRMKHELYEATATTGPRWNETITNALLHDELYPSKHKQKNRHELGAREFTITYSPKWFATDEEARVHMRAAMDKLMKYHRNEITTLRAVGEVGTNGLSHIHCYYELMGGRKITDKNFKRAWKYWDPTKKHGKGFQGGHHDTVKSASDFLGYIDKEIDAAWMEIKYPE